MNTCSSALTNDEKHEIDDNIDRVDNLQWEVGQYTFYDFVNHFELPNIVHLKRNMKTNVPDDKYILLHSSFDRYVIIARSKEDKASADKHYLLSDWCNCLCQITSPKPVLKTRWWVFQRAFELFRFEFPRTIKILSILPVHRRSSSKPNEPWEKVVLDKNVYLTAVSKCLYQSMLPNGELSSTKEGIILRDRTGGEYIVPPAVPLHFSTVILEDEMQPSYKNNSGEFNLSEVIMRYEFPLDVRLVINPTTVVNVELISFCVAKSILGISFGHRGEPQLLELSPELPFLLHCHRALTVGLPREPDVDMEEDNTQVDPADSNRYLEVLGKLSTKLTRPIEAFKEIIRFATPAEVGSISKAYEISVRMDRDNQSKDMQKPAYMDVESAIKYMQTPSEPEGVPFDQAQPENFTVHICPDLNNPYKEEISYELVEEDQSAVEAGEDDSSVQTSNGGLKRGSLNPNQQREQKLCETVVMQNEDIDPIPREVFAQTVHDIPDKLVLIPMS